MSGTDWLIPLGWLGISWGTVLGVLALFGWGYLLNERNDSDPDDE